MGLFDKLLDRGAKAIGDMVSDKVSEVVNGDNQLGDTLRNVKSAVSSVTGQEDTWEEAGSHRNSNAVKTAGTQKNQYQEERFNEEDFERKTFEEKLLAILENEGGYELRKNISPAELEQEYGKEIYDRNVCHLYPENITYGIYQNGSRVLLIRLWEEYTTYNHAANRQVKSFCDSNGVKLLDFFEYLPNRMNYMEQRIREQLV